MFWLLACAKQTAPRDFEALEHDLWAHYAAGDDGALVDDVRELRGVFEAADAPTEGLLDDLTEDEAALADVGVDPEPAVGMFTVGPVGCAPDAMEKILRVTCQDALYPDNYVSYERRYTSDEGAYLRGETAGLSWDTDYTADIPATGQYTASIFGGMRAVEDGEDGPYLLSRTAMPAPADTDPDTIVFDVDLQLEVFYPSEGGVTHVFAMWRNIDLPSGLGTDSEIGQALILNGLHGWDDKTTSICDEGRI